MYEMKYRGKFNNDIIIGDIPTFGGTLPMVMEVIMIPDVKGCECMNKAYISATPFNTLSPHTYLDDAVGLIKFNGNEVTGIKPSSFFSTVKWKTHNFLSLLYDALYVLYVRDVPRNKVILTFKSMQTNDKFEKSIIHKLGT